MTAVVFSSTTPVSTKPPKVLTEMNSRMAASVPTSCAMPLLADSGSMVTVCSGVGFRIWLMSPCWTPSWLACSAPRLTCQADATVAWRSLSTRRRKSSSPWPSAGTTMAASALPPSSADTAAARSGAVATSTREVAGVARGAERGVQPRGRLAGDDDGGGGRAVVRQRPVEQRDADDGDGDEPGEDEEGLGAQALADLPLGDQGDGRARRPHRAATVWRKTSDSSGGPKVNEATGPARSASARTRRGVEPRRDAEADDPVAVLPIGALDARHGRRPDAVPGAVPRRHRAGEGDRHVAVGCAAADVVDRALQHDAAVVDHDHVAAEVLDEVELVAAEEQRGAALHPLDQDLLEDVDGEWVEPGERLVEHEQVGVVDEGQGQLDPLLVAGRQVLDVGVAPVGEVDPLQPAVGGPLGLVPVQPGQSGVVDDVLPDPHLRGTSPARPACSRCGGARRRRWARRPR